MKLRIESLDKKVLVEKEYDTPELITEREYWNLYCGLISLTKTPLSDLEIKMLVFIFLEDPNESVFNVFNCDDLMNIIGCSRDRIFKIKKSLLTKGFLVPEDDEFPTKDVMLNNQLSRLQKKVKELKEKKNLKNIQLNFNLQLK